MKSAATAAAAAAAVKAAAAAAPKTGKSSGFCPDYYYNNVFINNSVSAITACHFLYNACFNGHWMLVALFVTVCNKRWLPNHQTHRAK